MLRRVLPVAAAAAALVSLPTTAFATPPQAPVENIFSASYFASTDVVLPDGRHVSASLYEYRGASQNGWTAALSLYVTGAACSGDAPCAPSFASGDVSLTDAQVAFTRNLSSASALEVPVTLWTSSMTAFPAPPTGEQVTVSLAFAGTGAVTRESYEGDLCADGGRVCQSHRLGADREATAELTFDGQTVPGPGHLSYGLATDTAAPKFVDGGY